MAIKTKLNVACQKQPKKIEQEETEGTEILLLRFLCFLLFKKLATKTSFYDVVMQRGIRKMKENNVSETVKWEKNGRNCG